MWEAFLPLRSDQLNTRKVTADLFWDADSSVSLQLRKTPPCVNMRRSYNVTVVICFTCFYSKIPKETSVNTRRLWKVTHVPRFWQLLLNLMRPEQPYTATAVSHCVFHTLQRDFILTRVNAHTPRHNLASVCIFKLQTHCTSTHIVVGDNYFTPAIWKVLCIWSRATLMVKVMIYQQVAPLAGWRPHIK